jgi:hypothetical protein
MSFLTSSSDSTQISRTIKGFLTALIPLIIAVTGLSAVDITPFIDALVMLVNAIAGLAAASQIVYGLARKLYLQRWSAV